MAKRQGRSDVVCRLGKTGCARVWGKVWSLCRGGGGGSRVRLPSGVVVMLLVKGSERRRGVDVHAS
jgi:hypothetical protein